MNFIYVLLFYQSDIKKEKYIFKFSVHIKKKEILFCIRIAQNDNK